MGRFIDLTGATIGRLTVLKRDSSDKRVAWQCRCECGNTTVVRAELLRSGKTKSCGCLKRDGRGGKDISRQRFGRLIAVRPTGEKRYGKIVWLCRCDCGKELSVTSRALISGNTKSCGCYKRELTAAIHRSHGLTRSSEYTAWLAMKSRCENPHNEAFKNYGGRGISVCRRWKKFENFLADMGKKPFPKATVERKNTNGNYGPSNCIWASRKQQCRNKRNNVLITADGESRTAREWSEITGLSAGMIFQRVQLLGWSHKDAITKPPSRGSS